MNPPYRTMEDTIDYAAACQMTGWQVDEVMPHGFVLSRESLQGGMIRLTITTLSDIWVNLSAACGAV